uniref:Vacuolar protein sorting-associated protein 26B (Trinotate prediction) n=1 Tax=Myxobolus squamalis TaxID=59785 RepID=A0A6B2G389_MYXSQ
MNTLIQFINPGSIQINVLDKPDRKSVKVLHDFEEYVSPIFYKGDSVKGNVKICVPLHQKPIKFKRLKISLIGTITDNKYFVKRTFSYETIEIIRAGSVAISTWFDFEFERPKLPYESFGGKLFEIEYILVATVVRSITNIECKHPIFVQVCGIPTPSVSKLFFQA